MDFSRRGRAAAKGGELKIVNTSPWGRAGGMTIVRLVLFVMLVPAVACAADNAKAAPKRDLTLAAPTPAWSYEELRRFPATEARQAAVADEAFAYAINNTVSGKYRKATGERVAGWTAGSSRAFIHMNAGIVWEGRLYCA